MMIISQFIETYWNYYLLLEEKFLNTLKYVELHENNFDTYSNEYASLICTIGAELDSVFKAFCCFKQTDYKTIKDYGNYIKTHYPRVLTLQVKVREKGILISPLDIKQNVINNSKTLFWWQAYDNIKHSRSKNEKDGNLRNTLYLLATLYLLEMFYMSKKLAGSTYIPLNDSKLFALIENYDDLLRADEICKPINGTPTAKDF